MTTTTMRQFIDQHNITIENEWADSNPNMSDEKWARTATHWKCTLKMGRKRLTTYFSQGSAHTDEPTAADILNSLASDASGYEDARSFEDWCSEYGYDTDSRKAENIYRTIGKQAKQLKQFLGDDYDTLLYKTERL